MGGYVFEIESEKKASAQIVACDLAKFSLKEDNLQLHRFRKLHGGLLKALENIDPKSEIVVLPTGDGLVIGVIGAELEPVALQIAFQLLESLHVESLDKELRVGVHVGPVYHLIGKRGEHQLIGVGINKAARVESAGTEGRVLVSEEYFSMFLDRSGDDFQRRLIKGEPEEFRIKKEPTFKARFVEWGEIGKLEE